MARINLLPWRQEARERKNKEFNVLAAATAGLTALAVLVALMFLNRDLDNQKSANQLITDQNAQLDMALKEIEGLEQQRDEMVSRMKVIQDLQGRRSVPVRIWDDIARAIPPAMYLTSIKREGDTITLVGYADNNTVVTQLVSNLDKSPWLADSRIPQIKTAIEAYQSNTANTQKPANGQGQEQERPVLPEDSYIEFTVTTQVKPDEPKVDENGNPIVDSGQGSQIPADIANNQIPPANANPQVATNNTANAGQNTAASPAANTAPPAAAPTNQAAPAPNQAAPTNQAPAQADSAPVAPAPSNAAPATQAPANAQSQQPASAGGQS